MKLEQYASSPAVLSDGLTEKTFNILANEKMFGILSSKIYTNKMLTPIRELSCNAYDANVEARHGSVPIQVHIPDFAEGECYFGVKDCGRGMSPSEIEDLYTTYGYSSKMDSNRVIGCLGLGSKSPFAYTDSFYVTSVKDGLRSSYYCMLENEIPKIVQVSCEKTDEPSGTEVRFDVKSSDIWGFCRQAESFFANFNPRPEFTGGELSIPDPMEFTCGLSRQNHGDCGVLMGNVLYRFNADAFLDTPAKDISGCVLKANIGDIDISVSRETVEMTQKSRDFIVREFQKRAAALVAQFEETKPSYTNPLEYFSAYQTYISRWKCLYDICHLSEQYKGFSIQLPSKTSFLKLSASRYDNAPRRVTFTAEDSYKPSLMEANARFVYMKGSYPHSCQKLNEEVVENKDTYYFVFCNEALKPVLEGMGIPVATQEDYRAEKVAISTGKTFSTGEGTLYGYYVWHSPHYSPEKMDFIDYEKFCTAKKVYYFRVIRGTARTTVPPKAVHKMEEIATAEGAVLIGVNEYRETALLKNKKLTVVPMETLYLNMKTQDAIMEEAYASIASTLIHDRRIYLFAFSKMAAEAVPEELRGLHAYLNSDKVRNEARGLFTESSEKETHLKDSVNNFICSRYPMFNLVNTYQPVYNSREQTVLDYMALVDQKQA